MKKTILNLAVFGALSFTSLACSQTNGAKENETKSPQVEDSAAIKAERKRKLQEEKAVLPKPYNPDENAEQRIAELIAQAKKENKNIMIQAGGNWCIWCLRFNNFLQTTPDLKQIVDENYLYYHLNYSPENKNEKIFEKYGDPGKKFGYPVFVVLDKNGKQIHTQSSEAFEEGDGYSVGKVKEFLEVWKPRD